MKKIVTFLLLLAMTLPVAACDNKQESTSKSENSVQQESSITTEISTADRNSHRQYLPQSLPTK